MVWLLGLLPILCASVLALGKDNSANSIVLNEGTIMVNTSTSGLTDAEGNTLVPGPGYFQETVIGKKPSSSGRQLPGLGNDIVVISESKQTKGAQQNIVNSRVQTVTRQPKKPRNDFIHGENKANYPRKDLFNGRNEPKNPRKDPFQGRNEPKNPRNGLFNGINKPGNNQFPDGNKHNYPGKDLYPGRNKPNNPRNDLFDGIKKPGNDLLYGITEPNYHTDDLFHGITKPNSSKIDPLPGMPKSFYEAFEHDLNGHHHD
ncbi:uncharacterized protein LOC122616115 [Drosophila teissieri]|uniref:uncharacterized protein LOC122616115 n=1 Tax=Drosophila teissieri TaxID=7243 RepID=UPI001CBA2630|nr:uncharacterized protein LOC122616115 [Drosophila teissieri]